MLKYVTRSKYATPQELYKDPHLEKDDRVMLEQTLAVFDMARSLHGKPLNISSGRRSQHYQDHLVATTERAAKHSPHVKGVALDILVPDGHDDLWIAQLLAQAAAALNDDYPAQGYQRPRMGFLKYRHSPTESAPFIHFDMAFLLCEPGMPEAWKVPGLIW